MKINKDILGSLRGARSELIVVFISRLGLALFSLFFLKLLLSVFDAAQYGLFTFLIATAATLNALIFSAANIPVTHFATMADNISWATRVFRTGASGIFIFSLLTISVISLAFYFFTPQLLSENKGIAGLLTGLWASVVGVSTVTSAFALGRRRRVYNAILNNGMIISRIVAVGTLLLFGVSGLFPIMISMALANLAVALVALFTLDNSNSFVSRKSFHEAVNKTDFVYTYRNNWLVSIGNGLLINCDKVFLAFFLPLEAIGLLAIYQQICRAVSNMTIGTFYQFISPFILRGVGGRALNQAVISTFLVSFFTFAPIMLFVWLLLPWFVDFFIGEIFDLQPVQLVLVALAVSLNQSSKTNELLFFHEKRVDLLKYPLFLSIFLFIISGSFCAIFFGLTGAIFALFIAGTARYILAVVILSSVEKK